MEELLEGVGRLVEKRNKKGRWMDGKKIKRVQNDGKIDSRKRAILVLLCLHGNKLSPTPSLLYSIELTCYSWLKMTYCSCLHALCFRFCLQYINTNFCSPTRR